MPRYIPAQLKKMQYFNIHTTLLEHYLFSFPLAAQSNRKRQTQPRASALVGAVKQHPQQELRASGEGAQRASRLELQFGAARTGEPRFQAEGTPTGVPTGREGGGDRADEVADDAVALALDDGLDEGA